MQTFSYIAYDTIAGREARGTVTAPDPLAAIAGLAGLVLSSPPAVIAANCNRWTGWHHAQFDAFGCRGIAVRAGAEG